MQYSVISKDVVRRFILSVLLLGNSWCDNIFVHSKVKIGRMMMLTKNDMILALLGSPHCIESWLSFACNENTFWHSSWHPAVALARYEELAMAPNRKLSGFFTEKKLASLGCRACFEVIILFFLPEVFCWPQICQKNIEPTAGELKFRGRRLKRSLTFWEKSAPS